MTLCQSTLKCKRWLLLSLTRSYLKQRRSWISKSMRWIYTKSLVPLSSSQLTTLFWRPMSSRLLVLSWVEWYKKARGMQYLMPLRKSLLKLSKFIRLSRGTLLLLLMPEPLRREDLLREQSDYTYNTEYNLSSNEIHSSIAKRYDTAVTTVLSFKLHIHAYSRHFLHITLDVNTACHRLLTKSFSSMRGWTTATASNSSLFSQTAPKISFLAFVKGQRWLKKSF